MTISQIRWFALFAIGVVVIVIGAWWLLTTSPLRIPRVGGQATEAEAIQFWHDDARGVGCWVYASGYKGGISCLPDDTYSR